LTSQLISSFRFLVKFIPAVVPVSALAQELRFYYVDRDFGLIRARVQGRLQLLRGSVLTEVNGQPDGWTDLKMVYQTVNGQTS
jgi:hypothetical protein